MFGYGRPERAKSSYSLWFRALEAKEPWRLALIALSIPPRPPPIKTASEKASIISQGIIVFNIAAFILYILYNE